MNMLNQKLLRVEGKQATLKDGAKYLFWNLPDVSLFKLKFYLLEHVIGDVKRFGSLNYLDASPFKDFSRVINKFIRMSSIWKTSCVSKAADAENKAFFTGDSFVGGKPENGGFGLEKDGVCSKAGCTYDSNIQKLTYVESETRDILACDGMKIVQEATTERRFILIASDIQLAIVLSRYIVGGSYFSLEHYDGNFDG